VVCRLRLEHDIEHNSTNKNVFPNLFLGGRTMTKQDILNDITKTLGAVPGWLAKMDAGQLETAWAAQTWFMKDTMLSARDKALVAFGAASANHCVF
jgi:hypothetical protein